MANELRFEAKGIDKSRQDVDKFADSLGNLRKTAASTQEQLSKQFSANIETARTASVNIRDRSANTGQLGADLAGNVGQLAQVIPDANNELRKAAETFDQVSIVASNATAVMGTLSLSTVAVVAVVGTLALAFNELKNSAEDRLEVAQKEIDAIRQQQDLAQFSADIAKTASREAIFAKRQELALSQQNSQEILQTRENQLNAELNLVRSFEEKRAELFGDTGAKILSDVREAVGITNVDELKTEVENASGELDTLINRLQVLQGAEIERAIAVNEQISALERERDLRFQLAQISDTLTAEEIERQIEQKQSQVDANALFITGLYDELITAFEGNTALEEFAKGQKQVFEETGEILIADNFLKTLENQNRSYSASQQLLIEDLRSAVDTTQTLNGSIEDLQTIALPTAQALEAQRDITEKLSTAVADLKQEAADAIPELTAINERIADLQATLEAEARSNNIDKLRSSIEGSLEARILEAKEAENQAQILRNIAQIRTKSTQKELELFNTFRATQQDAIDSFNQSVNDLNKDFMESELQATKDFYKEQKRLQEDFSVDYLRTLEDLNDNLLDAALDNDVKRFIQIQKQGEKDLRRSSEDFDTNLRRRTEDFTEERQQARDQFKQRLKDLDEQFKVERKARLEAYTQQIVELRENLQEQINAQRDAGRTRILESQRLEQQLTNLRNRWRTQDENQRRAIRLQGLRQELQDMQKHQANLRSLISGSFQQIFNSARNIAGGSTIRSSTRIPTISSPTPTRIPVPSVSGSGGFGSVNLNVSNLNVGEVVTPQQLNTQISGFMTAVSDAVGRI